MMKVTVLYPAGAGRFDLDYYLGTHMPLSIARLGSSMHRIEVEVGVCGAAPHLPAPHVAAAHFVCDSAEAFIEAFLPHAAELQGDMANYTDIEPIIQFSEIRLVHPIGA